MSVLTYEQEYRQVLSELAEVQTEDAQVSALRFGNDQKSRYKHFQQHWVSVYMRYLQLSRRLSVLVDAELQPQKQQDMRVMLDSCLGRMLEAKAALTENCGDFLAMDELLLDSKLTPDQAAVPIPSYLLEDRGDDLVQQRNYIASLQAHYSETEPEAPVTQALKQPSAKADPTKALPPAITAKGPVEQTPAEETDGMTPMTLDAAARLLQSCERGRQARQRVSFQLLLRKQQQYAALHGKEFNTVAGKDKAAAIVQKVALGYLERKRAAKRYEEEREFLGLTATAATFSEDERVAAELRAQDRKSRQRMNQAALRQKTLELESNIKTKEGPRTMEVMLDEVLMRMAYARMEGGDGTAAGLAGLPPPEEGGSLALLGRPTPSSAPAAAAAAAPGKSRKSVGSRASSAGADGNAVTAADQSGSAAPVEGAAGGQRKSLAASGKEAESRAAAPPPSAFWEPMREGTDRYNSVWKPKFEQSYINGGDLNQPADEMELRQELLQGPRGIMAELRTCVDQLVTMEVDNLRAKLQAEADARKKGKQKKKKEKREGKAKKPKLKDPTKGVDLLTSMNTAVFENKLQLPPADVRLSDFIGADDIMTSSVDRAQRAATPDEELKKKWLKILRGWSDEVEKAMGMKKEEFVALFEAYVARSSWVKEPSADDLRRAVSEYAVLPLGSQVIHDLAPHCRGMLFYGLRGTGKTLMAYALANEAGALFFNLSPANFTSTKGIAKTLQLVFYLARMKGPSVVYIEGIEKIFPAKKVKGMPAPPPAAGGGKKGKRAKDPLLARGKKMKKELLKCIGTVLPHERVVIVACTAEPWALDAAAVATHFQHALYFPLPNYSTRLTLLRYFVRSALRSSGDVAITSLTGETEGIPGDMPADGYAQLGLLTDRLTAGQIKTLVQRTVHPRRVERVFQRAIDVTDFLPALSLVTATAQWETDLVEYFHRQLPYTMRRANPAEDFTESEEESKKNKGNAGAKKKGAKASVVAP